MLLLPIQIQNFTYLKLKNSFKSTKIDLEDYTWIRLNNWLLHECGYAYRMVGPFNFRKAIWLHKEIIRIHNLGITYPDHENQDKLDNTKENLRQSNASLNAFNTGKQKGKYSSIYIGVGYRKHGAANKHWTASVRINQKLIHLGYFYTEIEAAKARDSYMLEHFPNHSVLNFPISC